MTKKVRGKYAYKPSPINKMVKLEVTVMLDAVPGAWHEPIDIMNWIASHNYVQSVELKE
jgi:hypothetical protein